MVDNIKMNHKIGLEGAGWIHLTYNRNSCQAVVNIVMNLWVP